MVFQAEIYQDGRGRVLVSCRLSYPIKFIFSGFAALYSYLCPSRLPSFRLRIGVRDKPQPESTHGCRVKHGLQEAAAKRFDEAFTNRYNSDAENEAIQKFG